MLRNWIKGLKENDMFQWGDLIVIGLLIVLSFSPLYFFATKQANQVEVTSSSSKNVKIIAVVTHNGKKLREFNLTDNTGTKTWTYKSTDGDYNIVQLKGHKIRVIEANCPDQIDVRMGYKSKVGESIVCLPHKFMIEIKSSDGKNVDGGLVN